MIGQTISHYQILEKLGEGGMGVVYKAEDLKLKRTVALKFLPRGLETHEPERARFLQEAQAAAALNHPNICTIYDIAQEGSDQFIVMEYVDGSTLRDQLRTGNLKPETAVAYAIQIGEALQEAHGKAIVHRDIKAENIMVNEKKQVKVMDFGLAKLKGSLKLTKTSSTVGTLAYMAPEQIQGQPVDARSDIFSFGVVLYEMLTGHLPFRGEHDAAMMYSILNEEPESLQRYLPDAPTELVHALDRAMEKDPEERYQTAHEMVIDLRRIKKRTSRVTRMVQPGQLVGPSAAEASTEPPDKQLKRPGSKRTAWVAASLAIACLAAIVFLIILPKKAAELNPDMTFRALPIPYTEVGVPSLSHDGNWSAFQAADANKKYDVYFMNTTSGEARRITLDSNLYGIVADLSADASHIVFDRYNAATRHMEIALVSTIGGLSRKIVDVGFFPRWRPDGDRIGYIRDRYDGSQSGKSEFWTVNSNGSENRCEFTDSLSRGRGQYAWMVFSWSPDGQAVCWVRSFSSQWQEVMVYDLASKRERQLTFDKKRVSDVCWAPNNQIIYSSDKAGNFNLWMVPASGGDAIQLTKGASPDMSGVISRDGSKLLCYQQQELSHIWIAGTDGSSPHQITFDDAFLWRVAFTPDGKQIVFGFHQPLGREKGERVCSIDRDGKNRRELTSREEVIGNPLPSPDGRWIVYGGRFLEEPFDSMKVYLIDAKNPGLPKLVCVGCPFRWIDPKTFISMDTDTTYRTWLNQIEGGQRRTFFEDSTFAIPLQGGKYIGYSDGRSGSRGLWVSAAPGVNDPSLRSPKKLLESPVPYGEFDKSGRFYYFVRNAGELRRISIPSGKEEVVRGTFPGLNPTFYHSTLDISYDGREIVYTDARYDSKLIMIEHPFN